MRKILQWSLLVIGLLLGPSALAQRAALRTNLLGLATANLNLEASYMLSPSLSMHLALQAKPFSYPLPAPVGLLRYVEGLDSGQDNLAKLGTIKHTENYTVQPSLRYWTRGVYNRGWFFGFHTIATMFKYGGDRFDANYRDGWGVGAGLSLGYSFELSKRFNLETELGIGGLYRSYNLVNGKTKAKSALRTADIVPSLSRFGVSIVYLL